ncbi:hypothetical protein BDP27DRAFT_1027443 [Rhodocollybia butyracea]|uniref:Uncharacterized protein n=1 Tax=Rhodocollybia butyracea TaxID=206335 RepID=A0A9P5P4Q3_9AGAR|nr:hypothetical protein BDP27DRAFT_1027443 [Rhodocollybia butyracea]
MLLVPKVVGMLLTHVAQSRIPSINSTKPSKSLISLHEKFSPHAFIMLRSLVTESRKHLKWPRNRISYNVIAVW